MENKETRKSHSFGPHPAYYLRGKELFRKRRKKNVLRHNGSKGQAANRATLYC